MKLLQERPKLHLRLCLWTLSLCGALIFYAYNSVLISHLTVNIDAPPFRTFEELAKLPSYYKVFVIRRGSSATILQGEIDRGNPKFKNIEDRIEQVETAAEASKRVLMGEGAFFRGSFLQDGESTLGAKTYLNLPYQTEMIVFIVVYFLFSFFYFFSCYFAMVETESSLVTFYSIFFVLLLVLKLVNLS